MPKAVATVSALDQATLTHGLRGQPPTPYSPAARGTVVHQPPKLRERLYKELETNVSLRVPAETEAPKKDTYLVSGRGRTAPGDPHRDDAARRLRASVARPEVLVHQWTKANAWSHSRV